MVDLRDFFGGSNPAAAPLEELRLGEDPVVILLFTAEGEHALLHYVKDETVRSYVACLGKGCPLCMTGSRPKAFLLLAVYEIESDTVKTLRIPSRRGSTTLAGQLLPHLKAPDMSNTALMISRTGGTYSVHSRPLGPNANRGETAISAFLQSMKDGLQLVQAFPSMTASEMAEIPRVSRLLRNLGGVTPSDAEPADEDA